MYLFKLVFSRYMPLCSIMSFCDPIDYSLPGSSVHGILLARILEWGAISSYRESSSDKCLGVGLLGHTVAPFLDF